MTTSPWQRALPPSTCDVAVVGGGIIGCATAFWLHRLEPSLRLVVLEAETLAYGASGRNAGFLLLGTHTNYAAAVDTYGRSRARQLWTFTAENVRSIQEHVNGAAFDLNMTGSLIAAGSAAEAAQLERSAALLAEDGAEVQFLYADAANARMGSSGFHGALFVAEGGTVHPAKLVRHLATQSGAAVAEGWSIEALEAMPGSVRLRSEVGVLEAEHVVLTLGAYLPRLVPDAERFVRPVRAQMLATAPVPGMLPAPIYSHDGFYYLRQQPDGRLLLGGARHRHEAEEVGYADATTAALQADLEAYLQTHFPAAGMPGVERRWSGTMGFSPDSLPVIGTVPGVPQVHFATGFTGHGMGFSLRMGRLLAHGVLRRNDRYAHLFEAARFSPIPDPRA